jgi:hypothetical protein
MRAIEVLGVLALPLCSACSSSGGGGSTSAPMDAGTIDAAPTPQGCQPARSSTSYLAGSTSSTAGSADGGAALEPCFVLTGMGAAESSIGIAADGTVFYAPAFGPDGNGIASTKDEGVTWQHLVPQFPGGGGHGRTQPFMYLDPSTHRVFFATSALGNPEAGTSPMGFNLSVSSDEGQTWAYEAIAPDVRDWIKIYAGPPVAGQSQPDGYANVVYASAPSPISTPDTQIYPQPDHQAVYQSLNGGSAWQSVGARSLTLDPSDEVDAGIASATTCPSTEWVIYGDGVVGSDGTIYLGLRMCSELAISISEDEGNTWKTVAVPGSKLPSFTSILSPLHTNNLLQSEPVGIDSANNLYAIWNDSTNLVRLSVSTDKGETWNGGAGPFVVSAPGVQATVYSAIAVKSAGTVAIAYYGSTDGTHYDGYIAESTNATSAQPVFQSAIANDPADHLFNSGFDPGYAQGTTSDLVEFVQVKYAPNGDIWASFVKEMCPGENTSACQWDYAAHANSVFQGAVGRLVHR